MPPGGPHFQQPYGPPPPGYPAPYGPGPRPGYGPPPGYPPRPQFQPQFPPRQQFQPSAYGPAQGGPPVVIDVGKANGRKAIIGSVVAGAIGLIAVVSGLAGAVDGGAGVAVVVIVIGVLFLLPAIFTIAKRDKVFRQQLLVFETSGVRWDDPRGAPWAVPWTELAAVSISKHSPKQVGPESLSDKLAGAASDKIAGERAHVRLDLFPADPSFAGRHPEMGHLWERQGVRNGYRLPLGSNVKFIPIIAGAMGRFAPSVYRGVNATEGMMGLN